MFVAYIGAGLVGIYGPVVFGQGALSTTDNVMPMPTLDPFPGPVAGVVLAAVLAAMLSSVDSQLLVATSAIVEDVRVLPRSVRRRSVGSAPATRFHVDDATVRARDTPEIASPRRVDAYWIVSRPDGDVIVDSVRSDEAPPAD